MSTNNKISNLVNSQVPFFVRNDHPNFILFLEKYYQYLEQTGKELERANKLRNLRDIDLTEDVFAEKLYSQFMALIPDNVIADKAIILKHAKDFYRSRGTEKSVAFIINALFAKEAEFYYPKTDVLRASDGKWFIEKSLKIDNFKVNNTSSDDLLEIEKFRSKKISGNTSGATAIVETVDAYYQNGILVYELKLSNQYRDFEIGETIFTYFEENGLTKTLTANTFGGILSSVKLESGGTGYVLGNTVPIESNTGTGARIIISGITTGNIKSIIVSQSGAGFQNGNFLLISGGGGSGANANVKVNPDGFYHPNSYNIVTSTISLEANTPINNTVYSNLNSANINTTVANAVNTFVYGNTGPVESVVILNPGSNYVSLPIIDVQANTRIRSLGILGRLEIANGGSGYQVGNKIEFINGYGSFGTGAAANVVNVNANGSITQVRFEAVPGQIVGGSGYIHDNLPTANVISSTGNGANVIVRSILGDGEILVAITDTIGTITNLTITNRGSGYLTPPVINLKTQGDGTALANATVIAGVFEFPGRYINDDGHISSYNFLQDRDYYQNYAYVVRTNEFIDNYRTALNSLTHPTGMKLFGEFLYVDTNLGTQEDLSITTESPVQLKFFDGTYFSNGNANGSNISINRTNHGYSTNQTVYLEFLTGSNRNLSTINIVNPGIGYSNGYINFTRGSGTEANAFVRVNTRGSITSVQINNDGTGYLDSDLLFANVDHLRTYNVANIVINNAGKGYGNGRIAITGGNGRNANVQAVVNSDGSIISFNYTDRGTGYLVTDNVSINVDSILSYNIANIPINAGGDGYSNGFIRFEGGSGRSANANVRVNATGSIVGVTINQRGTGYGVFDPNELIANVSHLATYRLNRVLLIDSGENYANGYITFSGGTGSGANANITVGATGEIVRINVNSIGTGYSNGDNVVANVQHLITHNVANINLISSGRDYSNGYINIQGGSGRRANAEIRVDANGTISNVIINSRGTGYGSSDVLYANVEHLLTFNIANISIANSGHSFSNGFITFVGGSGRGANANVIVDANGAISNVFIRDRGTGYLATDNVTAKIIHLTSFNVSTINVVSGGTGYSNGFITFQGGSGFGANANVRVNATGTIVSANVLARGTGYDFEDNITANVSSLGGANANLAVILQFGNPTSANLSVTLQRGANTANLPVALQLGSGNSIINVSLAQGGNTANLFPIVLQRGQGGANLTASLQQHANTANLSRVLRAEPINLESGIFTIANTTNANWFHVNYPESANSFGNVFIGTII